MVNVTLGSKVTSPFLVRASIAKKSSECSPMNGPWLMTNESVCIDSPSLELSSGHQHMDRGRRLTLLFGLPRSDERRFRARRAP
jgi:hypothetical protein